MVAAVQRDGLVAITDKHLRSTISLFFPLQLYLELVSNTVVSVGLNNALPTFFRFLNE